MFWTQYAASHILIWWSKMDLDSLKTVLAQVLTSELQLQPLSPLKSVADRLLCGSISPLESGDREGEPVSWMSLMTAAGCRSVFQSVIMVWCRSPSQAGQPSLSIWRYQCFWWNGAVFWCQRVKRASIPPLFAPFLISEAAVPFTCWKKWRRSTQFPLMLVRY